MNELLSITFTFCTILAAATYAISTWRNSKTSSNRDLLEAQSAQITAQNQIINSLQAQINKLTQDIGRLQGINDANEKIIKEYSSLIGPAGELQTTLKELRDASKIAGQAATFMEEVRNGTLSLAADLKMKQ